MNARIKIKKAFQMVFEDYKGLFKTHYPKASGGGMNEATQTYYFCKNLTKLINNTLENEEIEASSSLEMSYGAKKRMDGVVVSPSTNEIYLIQSKRLKNSNTNSVIRDVVKVNAEKTEVLKKMQLNNFKDNFSTYIVILADMWLHKNTPRKNMNRLAIPNWWVGNNYEVIKENFKDNPFHYSLIKPDEMFVNQVPSTLQWKNENQFLHRFYDYKDYFKEKPVLREYCLLCGFAEI